MIDSNHIAPYESQDVVTMAIAELIRNSISLKELILQDFEFSLAQSKILAKAIKENQTLVLFDIFVSMDQEIENYLPLLKAVSQHKEIKIFGIPTFDSSLSSNVVT